VKGPRLSDPDFDRAFGQTICLMRKLRNITLEEMAATVEVTPSAMSRIENARTKPTVVHLRKIARKLKVPGSTLMKLTEEVLEGLKDIATHSTQEESDNED